MVIERGGRRGVSIRSRSSIRRERRDLPWKRTINRNPTASLEEILMLAALKGGPCRKKFTGKYHYKGCRLTVLRGGMYQGAIARPHQPGESDV